MTALDRSILQRIRGAREPEPDPTLRDWVESAIAPPGRKVDEATARLLDELVNRGAARKHMRGRGPYQHFTVRRDLPGLILAARRRSRRFHKKLEARRRARGGA